MKIVKADAKGRVTGFEPGEEYMVGENYQGVRTLTPSTVRVPDQVKEVTREEFEGFFGGPLESIAVENGVRVTEITGKGYYPYGLLVRAFLLQGDGTRLINQETGNTAETTTVIKILKP